MAEERTLPVRLSRRRYRVTNVVDSHRVNNVTYGHVGRLTYFSPEGDDNDDDGNEPSKAAGSGTVGELHTNRITDSKQTFRQVTPLETWYPATNADALEQENARVHPQWLLKTAPEALVGTAGPVYAELVQDVKASAKLARPPQTRRPLLGYGEITDVSAPEPTGCAALAMAVGELRHVLRVVPLRHERWAWPGGSGRHRHGDAATAIDVAQADTAREGHWCGDGLAINQIQFATQPRGSATPARWLLVQTAAATLVFAPTLLNAPTERMHAASCGHGLATHHGGPAHVAMNLRVRVAVKDTGGGPQCDAAFNPGTETEPPQLGIVDTRGNWSVWDLTGDRHLHKAPLRPVLRARGHVLDGVPPSPFTAAADGLGHLHRLAWLSSSSSSSSSSRAPSDAAAETRSNTLLLGNATTLNVVNVPHMRLLHTLNVANNNGLDVVLDIQRSPANPSHVFVLTAVALLWLDLSPPTPAVNADDKDDSDAPGAAAESSDRDDTDHPVVLLSCPHFRSAADRTMKLCVSAAPVPGAEPISLACIYSAAAPDITVFWLVDPSDESGASYQQQLFRLTRPAAEISGAGHTAPSRISEQALIVFRAPVVAGAVDTELDRDPNGCTIRDGPCFFQVVAFGADFSIRSGLCVSAPLRRGALDVAAPIPPTVRAGVNGRNATSDGRQSLSKYLQKSFVVPDDFDERTLVRRSKAKRRLTGPTRLPTHHGALFDMSHVVRRLDEAMLRAADAAYRATNFVRTSQNPSPVDVIRRIVEMGLERGSFPYTTLLDVVTADEFVAQFGADLTSYAWARQLVQLGLIEAKRAYIFDQMQEGRRHNSGNAATLHEAMARVCALPAEADGGSSDADRVAILQRQRHGLLAHAAVQLFLSQISMIVVPRQRAEINDSSRTTPTLGTGLRAASARSPAFSSPPPSARDVPAWLQSSSQEYGVKGEDDDDDYDDDGDHHQHRHNELGRQENGLGGVGHEAQEDMDADERNEAEDPTIARLRQYVRSVRTEPAPHGSRGELRLLAHWQLGSDPAQFSWKPTTALGEMEEEMARQADEARERRRKRDQRRTQGERERRLALGGPGGLPVEPSAVEPGHAEPGLLEPGSAVVAAGDPNGGGFTMSHHCHDEHVGGGGGHDHHDHDHGHGHGHGHGGHDHSDDLTPALQHSLYQHIDFDQVVTLNEARAGAGRAVVRKTWADRLAPDPELASDVDPQLLMHVPFTGQVQLHAVLLRTSATAAAPRTLHVFQNREDLDFGSVEDAVAAGQAAQTFELAQTADVQELAVKRARFGQVRRLTLFFPDNFGDDQDDDDNDEPTRVSYVGFRGAWMQLGRAPVNILYEAAANPSDHALKGTAVNQMGSHLGGHGRGHGS
ncbi:DUF1000 domain containing protein [Niveomyces insectorum RCEF 264]|uniref:DUF1000 domain containing protein n=1 Tax=Niveomyces insectorum RCEF 264 TaxID=1081102 RepID=A0A167ZTN8_9HYPO|nr:DUF1000 domain containing protein [Niveomyces insectorum RCEF 264]